MQRQAQSALEYDVPSLFRATSQSMNVKFRHGHVTNITAQKQQAVNILSVCLQPQLPSIHGACSVLYCHLWPARLYNIFPHYLINSTFFGEKKLLNLKCVFRFSLQLLSEALLILRRIQRYMIINIQMFLCKVAVILVRFQWNVTFHDRFSRNPQMPSFVKIRPVGFELFQADRQT